MVDRARRRVARSGRVTCGCREDGGALLAPPKVGAIGQLERVTACLQVVDRPTGQRHELNVPAGGGRVVVAAHPAHGAVDGAAIHDELRRERGLCVASVAKVGRSVQWKGQMVRRALHQTQWDIKTLRAHAIGKASRTLKRRRQQRVLPAAQWSSQLPASEANGHQCQWTDRCRCPRGWLSERSKSCPLRTHWGTYRRKWRSDHH